ncbi:Ser/Thr protein phosphatase family protein [Lachnospiraceae bacterium TWA4]|nr:Ser/Thr protein phosphatase family protein [Lachnospiraceae bacterium TWA4]
MKKHKLIITIIILIIIMCVSSIYSYHTSKYSLTTTPYTLQTTKLSTQLRILHLSDLHNSQFGDNNEDLLTQVSTTSPDLILITGDLVNSDDPDATIALNLVKDLVSIAPVYISLGNHEIEYKQNFGTDLTSQFTALGAKVLDFSYEDIELKNQSLRIGGIYGYCLPTKYFATGEARINECNFLTDFQNTDRYTILLCHMPIAWLINDGLDEWDVDCVFSGHVHGGQVILPFIGGLYGPDLGWFPGKLSGLYYSSNGEKTLVLSRGLGSTEAIPRFNNIPEIVTVDLK